MKLSFDYYKNLESVDFYLCNPDGTELFPIVGSNRNLTLRFNDLSELTFDIGDIISFSDGTVLHNDAYDYIQTKRLINATNIGWFQITSVTENNDGLSSIKSVQCESLQAVFKNRGFVSEERVYCFYNPMDPYDDEYDSSEVGAMPSVLGQLNKQLGIEQDLTQGTGEPSEPYDDWTVTYISSQLIYSQEEPYCRTFKESTTYGYDWMVNDVEEAFSVVVLFDFMNKTIQVKTPEEVTEQANVIYTFSNFMNGINIEENDDDIVTVLSCKGTDCDISLVNPTGTTYICDFSYYMDDVTSKWMSEALINKLKAWNQAVEDSQKAYSNHVTALRYYNFQKQQLESETSLLSLSLQDLKNARDKYISSASNKMTVSGVVTAEQVDDGKCSLDETSQYNATAFDASGVITCYDSAPTYNAQEKTWSFTKGASKKGTATANYNEGYKYFLDNTDSKSYCCLKGKAVVKAGEQTASYVCSGFTRYIAYDDLLDWIAIREKQVSEHNKNILFWDQWIEIELSQISAISDNLNILKYFADTPALLKELNCYWIEGEYVNEHIAILENTTVAEEIDLCNELLATGRLELSKMCQPRFSFTIESADATKSPEFVRQMNALELGKIITIEKAEEVWYYPALLEISMNLDVADTFSLSFANALRLDDWGYTYADLISNAASTSRQVSANWQNLTRYAKDKDTISEFIKKPLDATMRAGFANGVNQEFIVDSTGILGRKKLSENSDDFEDAQIRILNNLILFTDDNWGSVKTALGRIVYTDDKGNPTGSSYGLIADTIIGSLLLGEHLVIKNDDSSVSIDKNGITIKQIADDGTKTSVFEATPDGSLIINAVKKDGNGGGYQYSLLDDGFSIYSIAKKNDQSDETIRTLVLKVDASGLSIEGEITATAGTIGGCKIDENGKLIVDLAYVKGTLSANNISANIITADYLLTDGKIKADFIDAETINSKIAKVGCFYIDGDSLTTSAGENADPDDSASYLITTLSADGIYLSDISNDKTTSVTAAHVRSPYGNFDEINFSSVGTARGLDSSMISTTKGGFSDLDALLQYLIDNLVGGNNGGGTGDDNTGDDNTDDDNTDTGGDEFDGYMYRIGDTFVCDNDDCEGATHTIAESSVEERDACPNCKDAVGTTYHSTACEGMVICMRCGTQY